MSVHIQKAGILTTIQDLGRNGFRSLGINPNGAMDKKAARLINILLGNDETEAVLETHFPAPVLEFAKETVFALGGADFCAKLNERKIENWRLYFAEKGSVLEFTEKKFGNRAYLAVKDGFAIEKWLESSSTNLRAEIGGFEGGSLRRNDGIEFNRKRKMENGGFKNQNLTFPYKISNNLISPYSSFPTVRVTAGAEFERLTGLSEEKFLTGNFTVSNNSDRMGFRLSGEPLYLIENIELVSSAVDFGTIQLLPDGQIIVLMADHQTSGGYPRVAHVASVDLPASAQLGANDKVNFQLISVAEAEELLLEVEKDLNLLKIACSFKNIRNF
ncbi:MAG TPA: biotin-dependent carboxyltransferase family protein [Pyrinomonadaceae bacterium]|nr:biotin-dependent carboxyltransferase family protein [Pyrinomonadaceae bacterium]